MSRKDLANSLKHINQMAIAEIRQKNYDKAIDYFTQSLVLEEKLGLKKQVGESFYNLASTYFLKKEFFEALKKAKYAHAIFEDQNAETDLIKTQSLIMEIERYLVK